MNNIVPLQLESLTTTVPPLLIPNEQTLKIESLSTSEDDHILKEYIVIVKDMIDLDGFISDMESPDGNLYIPNRRVEISELRPMSKSTHYMLTDKEADTVRQDPRISDVILTFKDKGFKISPLDQRSAYWDKTNIAHINDKNWGLYRAYSGEPISKWGSDGTTTISGTINLTNTGKNVDVVICDGHLDPNHPEFAVNPDGSGGSRFVQYNWFQHNKDVMGTDNSTYDYVLTSDANDGHGFHVAGTACGNTQGWARSCNIYNISPYQNHPQTLAIKNWQYFVIDYIRAFHKNKEINPVTGRKNPTIVNTSWGLTGKINLSLVDNVILSDVTYPPQANPWTSYRASLGLVAGDNSGNVFFMVRDESIDKDVVDAINEGIIFVGAAGNYFMYNATQSDNNYNNALRNSQTKIYLYYMRGPSPGAANGVISVSAINDTVDEKKAQYSNAGTRTDIFSPGTSIMSTYNSLGVGDPRNSEYFLTKLAGTSMATPQVTGVLACALEIYPYFNQTSALNYLKATCSKNQLSDNKQSSTFPFLNYDSLLFGPNLYLKYKKERADIGTAFPKIDFNIRPDEGLVYPRRKKRILG